MVTTARVIMFLVWLVLVHHAFKSFARQWKAFAVYATLAAALLYAMAIVSG